MSVFTLNSPKDAVDACAGTAWQDDACDSNFSDPISSRCAPLKAKISKIRRSCYDATLLDGKRASALGEWFSTHEIDPLTNTRVDEDVMTFVKEHDVVEWSKTTDDSSEEAVTHLMSALATTPFSPRSALWDVLRNALSRLPDVNAPLGSFTAVQMACVGVRGREQLERFFNIASECGARLDSDVVPTPLMLAARTSNAEAVRILIQKGSNLDAADGRGRTALLWAACANSIDIVRMLVDGGADAHRRSRDGTNAVGFAVKTLCEKTLTLEVFRMPPEAKRAFLLNTLESVDFFLELRVDPNGKGRELVERMCRSLALTMEDDYTVGLYARLIRNIARAGGRSAALPRDDVYDVLMTTRPPRVIRLALKELYAHSTCAVA